MWHIDAEIICLLFMLVILADISKNSASNTRKDQLFYLLSGTTSLAILVDIFSSFTMMTAQTTPCWILEGSMILYCILTPILSVLWHLYAIAVVAPRAEASKPKILLLSGTPFLGYAAIVLSNPLTGWMFQFSPSGAYARGPLFNIIFVVFYGYSAATLFLAFLNLKKIERATGIVLLSFPLIAGLGILLQQIFPTYLLTGAAFTLDLLITYLFLQNRKATRDHLTGLFNRMAFSTRIDKLAKFNEEGAVLAVAIDDFKLFNQTFGQKSGDQLLRQIAAYLVDISPSKTCYRYGGDIFTLILQKSSEQKIRNLADIIMNSFAKSFYIDHIGYTISASIGIVEYPQQSKDKNHSIITALDFAIYQAKKRGKGQVAFFNEELIQQFTRKYEVMDAITRALESKSFEIYLQPIYHVAQKKFVSAEALLRLKDEKLGWISPAELVPIAEETGQIVAITYLVLERVCAFLSQNREVLRDEISISVNFSVIQFMQNDMVERVQSIIQHDNINPSLIKIEVTESIIVDSFDDIKTAMLCLNQYGIRFALDDYGQGYSNISYLINLPFQVVKLDKSIIDNIVTESQFIRALVPMFQSLDKVIIAEGVETKEQLAVLDRLSCNAIQGYYFSKPLPMEQALPLFRAVAEPSC